MSPEHPSTSASPAEDVFNELEKELQRLKSAVSHLSLSEQAATKAIEAAEQVLHRQAELGQQLTDYVSRLPQPAEPTAPPLAQLTAAVERQQEVLDHLAGQLTRLTDQAAPPDPSKEDTATPLLQDILTRQEQLATGLGDLQRQLKQGIAHYPSQQLTDFLQQLVEPLALPQELQPTVTRSQQILQELSLQVKTLTSSGAQQQAGVIKELQALSGTMKLRNDQGELLRNSQLSLGEQSASIQKLLQGVSQQLRDQPAQATASPVGPDMMLHQQVWDLAQTVATQQTVLKRQQLIGLATLLAVLASLALHFLGL